jgi:hypothetical protein
MDRAKEFVREFRRESLPAQENSFISDVVLNGSHIPPGKGHVGTVKDNAETVIIWVTRNIGRWREELGGGCLGPGGA